MAEHYPASEDIDTDLYVIEDLWGNEALLQNAIEFGLYKAMPANQDAFDASIGRSEYSPEEITPSLRDKIKALQNLHSLRVVRIDDYDEDVGVFKKELDPNDPKPLFDAYARVLNDPQVPGLMKKGLSQSLDHFRKWRTTSAISLHFQQCLDKTLKKNELEPYMVETSVTIDMKDPKGALYTAQWSMMYPGFYRKFKEVYVAINNHNLIKYAAEKNREYDPIKLEPVNDSLKRAGFTWNYLEAIAQKSADEAFVKTKELYSLELLHNKNKEFVETSISRIERELKSLQAGQSGDVNFLRGFMKQSGMKFKVDRENENSKMAIRRFAKEYREFAGKCLDDLEKNRGFESVLAIAIARMRGFETVSNIDMADAAKRIKDARNNVGTFTSARKMIDSITGHNSQMTDDFMQMLDRRRSFARNFDNVAKFGQRASRISAGDSHATKEHIEEGKRFAASTFLRAMTRNESIAKSMLWEFNRQGLNADSLGSGSKSKGAKILLNHFRKEMTREEAQRREKEEQALRSDAPAALQDSLGNERERDQRPDPDPSPTRDPRPRR